MNSYIRSQLIHRTGNRHCPVKHPGFNQGLEQLHHGGLFQVCPAQQLSITEDGLRSVLGQDLASIKSGCAVREVMSLQTAEGNTAAVIAAGLA
ncbi:MAG: hypothetical protein K0Q90_4298 [Paenibacillaceae bacterium]|jgi:hypothetical protein|nr:hypothetical protein [Paenibacillaceae bacterium]